MEHSKRASENSLLVQDMRDVVSLIKDLDLERIAHFLQYVIQDNIFLTGEGSSRIFPAKKVICDALHNSYRERFVTEGATQALEYDLKDYTVFVASNSGKTRECVRLMDELHAQHHDNIFSVVAHAGTPVMKRANHGYVLSCGEERAVASTKSVVEQALFFDMLFRQRNHRELPDCDQLAHLFGQVLAMEVPETILAAAAEADTIYFSGRNNGVAEELVLKANEIARKKADYLEGTYALHGVEEVMKKRDVIIVIDPFPEEEEKFKEVLATRIGIRVLAIASCPTMFPTMVIPDAGEFQPYLELAAGWNMLAEAGLRNGIDIDHPARARKMGNEFEV
jgi:glucosamine--fructose-6-phosphate aminotransferase (isomerizing)